MRKHLRFCSRKIYLISLCFTGSLLLSLSTLASPEVPGVLDLEPRLIAKPSAKDNFRVVSLEDPLIEIGVEPIPTAKKNPVESIKEAPKQIKKKTVQVNAKSIKPKARVNQTSQVTTLSPTTPQPAQSIRTLPESQSPQAALANKPIEPNSLIQQNTSASLSTMTLDQTMVDNMGGQAHYSGEKISLNFHSIPVRDVLQILAEFIHKNVIISDAIGGTITLTLKDVPWDQVLALVLKSNALGTSETNNILIIAPAAELVKEEQTSLTSKQALDDLAPLYTESFSINYGQVADYYALLQDRKQTLLSSRGHVVKLNNSNTLIVEDTAKKLASIRALFEKMDHPAKQVLIEARIVSVQTTYQKNLGIKWGATDLATGNKFDLDLSAPSQSSSGSNTSLGTLTLGTLINGTNLNLELQAIEAAGEGEVVSSPRILTSNNVAGDIQQGTQIPYTTSAANGGTTTQFIQAVLELQVKPQITPNNKLLLNIVVTQDAPIGTGNPPSISTRKLTTMIMVNNEQTIVLGGVYDQTKTSKVIGVPWLSGIPLLGNFFKAKVFSDIKSELLIFLTPKIIDVNEKGAEFDV